MNYMSPSSGQHRQASRTRAGPSMKCKVKSCTWDRDNMAMVAVAMVAQCAEQMKAHACKDPG